MSVLVERTRETARQLREDLLGVGVDVAYGEGEVQDAELRYVDHEGDEVRLWICLSEDSVVIETESGREYDFTMEEASTKVMSAYQ